MKLRSLSILLLVLALTTSACLLSNRQKVQMYATDELTMVRVKPGVTDKQLERLADQLSGQNITLDYSESEYDALGKRTVLRFSVKGAGFSASHRTSPFDQPLLFGPYALIFFGVALVLIITNFITLVLKAKSLKR